jgi:hypothetical protein
MDNVVSILLILVTLISAISLFTTPFLTPISFFIGAVSLASSKHYVVWWATSVFSLSQIVLLTLAQVSLWFSNEFAAWQDSSPNTFLFQNFFPRYVCVALCLAIGSILVMRSSHLSLFHKYLGATLQCGAVCVAIASIAHVIELFNI